MFEDNIRGGLSQISKRYAKANNKYLSKYAKKQMDEYILYLDANNLYGYSMCQYLPIGNFEWNHEEWTNDKILALNDEGTKGYLFLVDLEYPEELHDLHNGYPLAPEKLIINNDMLNIHQQKDRDDPKISKLTTSFYDKKFYGVNYRLLKLYIQLGLKITKIHKVIQYDQDNYMKSYIMKNTEERKKANNEFEKDFYKLMNNSVYGKTMENVRNRINFKLVSTEEDALACRNVMKKRTIFNENCVGVHLLKREVVLNKPIFIGQNVLDQAKYLMYDFHYNFILKKFKRENIDLLLTDTDSLCYHIRKQDPYEIIAENKNMFDLSAYPKDHPLYDATNKKVIAKFKDEAVDDGIFTIITEFCGHRSKCYAYKTYNSKEEKRNKRVEEHKKCKGVKQYVIKQDLSFESYYNALFDKEDLKIEQNIIRSYKHQLYTETVKKVGLSCKDDKVYILDDNINTLTLGHYKIKAI
jgi:hypothetical protein